MNGRGAEGGGRTHVEADLARVARRGALREGLALRAVRDDAELVDDVERVEDAVLEAAGCVVGEGEAGLDDPCLDTGGHQRVPAGGGAAGTRNSLDRIVQFILQNSRSV